MAEKKVKVKKKSSGKEKEPNKKNPPRKKIRWATASSLSRIFRWDISTTKTLRDDGVIKLHRNGKYDLDECIKSIGDWRVPSFTGPSMRK